MGKCLKLGDLVVAITQSIEKPRNSRNRELLDALLGTAKVKGTDQYVGFCICGGHFVHGQKAQDVRFVPS